MKKVWNRNGSEHSARYLALSSHAGPIGTKHQGPVDRTQHYTPEHPLPFAEPTNLAPILLPASPLSSLEYEFLSRSRQARIQASVTGS